MILAIKTDQPRAELYLLRADGSEQDQLVWQADRQLAQQLLPAIEDLLAKNKLKLHELSGIIVFTGSGSFTGLRIGTTVANALAYGENIPVVAIAEKDWLNFGLAELATSTGFRPVTPSYESEPNITLPKAKT